MKKIAIYYSPVGAIQIEYENGVVTALKNAEAGAKGEPPSSLAELVFRQLDEYFAGTRTKFAFPYRLHGTPFQEKVWEALRQIPYGETRSYAQIAAEVGRPGAARAVGMACHRNPVLLFVPCHRVVGADGRLVGFAAGLKTKQILLEWERSAAATHTF